MYTPIKFTMTLRDMTVTVEGRVYPHTPNDDNPKHWQLHDYTVTGPTGESVHPENGEEGDEIAEAAHQHAEDTLQAH